MCGVHKEKILNLAWLVSHTRLERKPVILTWRAKLILGIILMLESQDRSTSLGGGVSYSYTLIRLWF